MGVPTMYALMIKYYEETYGNASEETITEVKEQLQQLRYRCTMMICEHFGHCQYSVL